MRRRVLAGMVAAAALVPMAPAAAGGWWSNIRIDGNAVGVGETVTAEAHVMFASMREAETAQASGGYHAYLIRGFDRSLLDEALSTGQRHGWWRPPEEAIHLGEVDFSGWDANLADATATFVVPEVAPGTYEVMFCTLDCAEPLADLIPALDVAVFGDAPTARLARDVAGLTGQLQETAFEVASGMDGLREEVRSVRSGVERAAGATSDLAASLEEFRASSAEPAPAPPSPGWTASGGWFLAGAAVTLVFAGRRRRGSAEADTPQEQPDVLATSQTPPEFITRA
jgi:hypothetical protein